MQQSSYHLAPSQIRYLWKLAIKTPFVTACCLGAAVSTAQDYVDGQSTATIALDAEYITDVVGVAQGPGTGVRRVDLLSIAGELDLEAVAGLSRSRLVAQLIAGTGEQPNELAGTLQGINNNEVHGDHLKLYQFYFAHDLEILPATFRVGFIDLNEDFYSNDAAGLLIAPAFGIGSELAATGPNGPSIFPSTALTATIKVEPNNTSYASFAAVNAEAGVLGDQSGVPSLFENGALLIGEAGWTGWGKFAAGAWRYTDRQDDLRDVDHFGDPLGQWAQGAYALIEMPLSSRAALDGTGSRSTTFFARAGVSDGNTTPYYGGWQAGLLVEQLFASRPDSQFSIGANQAFLNSKFRLIEAEVGNPQRGAETGFEITYADRLAPWLTLQGDAQYVLNASRAAGSKDAVILGIRVTISHSEQW